MQWNGGGKAVVERDGLVRQCGVQYGTEWRCGAVLEWPCLAVFGQVRIGAVRQFRKRSDRLGLLRIVGAGQSGLGRFRIGQIGVERTVRKQMSKSIMQPDGERVCFLTGSRADLDKHHCFHGIRRAAAEKWGCWIWLRHDLHMELHDRNKALDKMIERACQERFEEIYSHEEFMEVFGKSYL